MTDANVI